MGAPLTTRRAQTEHALQAAVSAYLNVALPDDCWFTSIDHANHSAIRGAMLKRRGVRPGLPDVCVLAGGCGNYCARPRGTCHGLFIGIELKAKAGRLSPEQVACHARIRAAGGEVIVCRSVEEVESALRSLGVPLKATVGRAA